MRAFPAFSRASRSPAGRRSPTRSHAQGRQDFRPAHAHRPHRPPAQSAGGREALSAPSAVAAAGQMYTDAEGMKPHPVPEAMTEAELKSTDAEYVKAATNAVRPASTASNCMPRTAICSNSSSGRIRTRAPTNMAARSRTARASCWKSPKPRSRRSARTRSASDCRPFGVFNDMPLYPEMEATTPIWPRSSTRSASLTSTASIIRRRARRPCRTRSRRRSARRSSSTLILSGGYDAERAEADLAAGKADLIAFGKPFLANPDLVGAGKPRPALNAPDMATFYTPGPKGYTDYPALAG